MAFAIEEVYRSVLQMRKPSVRVDRPIPHGDTPLAWNVVMDEGAEKVTREEFQTRYAEPAGQALADEGLEHGCDHFAALRVQDRQAAAVRGHTKVHKRERAFIVHALGWKGEAK